MEPPASGSSTVKGVAAIKAGADGGVHGLAQMSFSQRSGSTRLRRLFQRAPLRVLFPHFPRGEILSAVVANTSGGLVGGDRLDVDLDVASGARTLVTTQAAEKVYRSTGLECLLSVDIHASESSWVEWLPHETIIFDGARIRRRVSLNVDGGARVLAGDLLVFGRRAHGENLSHGLVHDEWQVRVDSRLSWADTLRLDGDLAAKQMAPAGLDGSNAMATLLYVAPDAERWLQPTLELIGQGDLRSGASCVGGLLIVRWLGRDAAVVRRDYGAFRAKFRSMVGGLPPTLPVIWDI
jgi:urease accessory protein